MNLRSKNILLVGLLMALVSGGAVAATITVDSSSDVAANDGKCTLREAITAANTNAPSGGASGECPAGGTPPVTINFNISGAGCAGSPAVCTIALTSAMPQITTDVFLNGYTQPLSSVNTLAVGNDAVLLIEIDGTNGNTAPVLSFQGPAGASTVSGLVINRIGNPIVIGSTGNTVTITGNFLGSNPAGTAIPGAVPMGAGVVANGGSNTIGGPAPEARNLMVGDFNNGVAGINLNAGDANLVQGNYIGTNAAGTAKLGASLSDGILVHTNNNQIGGVGAAGNVIAVNDGRGIFLIGATGNMIEGNLIGTNAAGTAALSTGNSTGVTGLHGSANTIGGTGAGQGNVISGNNFGITFIETGPGWLIQNNKIGTDITGTLDVYNGQCGIIADSGSGTIGGAAAGFPNVIAFNGAQGVNIAGGAGWVISGNSIFGNGGLGISFSGSCSSSALPTDNDSGDADPGPNNRQNYPVIGTVTIGPNTMAHVSGSLNSTASTIFHLEFFANANCDQSHNGAGKKFLLPAHDVTTNPNDVPFGPFDFTVPAHRHVITATATDPAGNTSEFSACSTQDTIFTDGYEGD